jgi:hypothetical protein
MTDSEATAMAEAIKVLEPALRTAGKAPSWERFHQQFHSGMFSEEILLQNAIDNSAADKVDWSHEETGTSEARTDRSLQGVLSNLSPGFSGSGNGPGQGTR